MSGIPTGLISGTAWVIGGGPSLRGFDPALLAGRTVIATNEAFSLFPDALALVFADQHWWERRRVQVIEEFHGIIITRGSNVPIYRRDGIHWMEFRSRVDWSRDPKGMGHHNAGLIALNCAYLMGASAAVLLGFDMRMKGKRGNYHDRHPPQARGQQRYRQQFIPEFERAARRIEEDGFAVVNATPGSALGCFPKKPLEWCLEHMG